MPHGVARSPEEMELLKIKILQLVASTCEGNFGKACKLSGVGLSEAYEWREADEGFKRSIVLARTIYLHDTLDIAESKTRELLELGDGPHIRWFLDRQGRERGYIPLQKNILEGGDKPVGISGEFTLTFGTEDNDGNDDELPAGDQTPAAIDGTDTEMETPAALPKTI